MAWDRTALPGLFLLILLAGREPLRAAEPVKGAATPESRALAYLACEVLRWATDNRCYSCHNGVVDFTPVTAAIALHGTNDAVAHSRPQLGS